MHCGIVLVVFAALLADLQFSNAQSLQEVQETCEPNARCYECFNLLVYETVRKSENQFNLQTAFYPPDTATPVYVIVNYRYRDIDGDIMDSDSTWFWSTSTYYLYQPPAVLQFTSLFFADPSFRTSRLALTLPVDCINASIPFMQLLTQRLRLLASSRSAFPSIDAEYEPKAESFNTIIMFIENNGIVIPYLVITHIVFFVAALALEIVVIFYVFFENNRRHKNSFINKMLKIEDSKVLDPIKKLENGRIIEQKKSDDTSNGSDDIIIENKVDGEENEDETENEDKRTVDESTCGATESTTKDESASDYDKTQKKDCDMSYEDWQVKSTLVMHFVLSMVVSLYIVLMSIIGQCHGNKLAGNQHPEIKEIFTFMKNSKLKCLFYLTLTIMIEDLILLLICIIPISYLFFYKTDYKWWVLCIASPVFPIAHILVHLTHIIIGFIHNERHATSVGLFYVGSIILQVGLLKILSHMYFTYYFSNPNNKEQSEDNSKIKKFFEDHPKFSRTKSWVDYFNNHYFKFGVLYFICSVILFLLLTFVSALYILLPINNALDEAPNRLSTVISGIGLLLGGYIVYLLKHLKEDKEKTSKCNA